MEDYEYGEWGGAEAHLTIDMPEDPTAMAPEQLVSEEQIASYRYSVQAADAQQGEVLADVVNIAFSELDAYVLAHPHDFQNPDEPTLIQVTPGLPIHSSFKAVLRPNSKLYAEGNLLRYIVPDNDAYRLYVYDESVTSCDALDGDRIQLCAARHEFHGSGVSFHRRAPGSTTAQLCDSSWTTGFSFGGFSMGITVPICNARLTVAGLGSNYHRTEYDHSHPRGDEGIANTPIGTLVSRPNGGDTLLQFKISARTCGIITCTTYGPAYGT
jgi:hypothetical protein